MRLTNGSGGVASKVETDPLGTQVSDASEFNQNGGGSGYGLNPQGFYGDPTMPNMGCSEGGFDADCNKVQRDIQNGVAVQCPQNNCGWRAIRDDTGHAVGLASFHAYADGSQFFLAAGVSYFGNNTFSLPGGLFASLTGDYQARLNHASVPVNLHNPQNSSG